MHETGGQEDTAPTGSVGRRLRVALPALVLGVILVAAALVVLLRPTSGPPPDLSTIGATVANAGCGPVITRAADGNAVHRPVGEIIDYPDAPPAFGPHWPVWLPMSRKFYSPQDRPALEYLVHNEEHGFTILWYDSTVAADPAAMDELRNLAADFPSTTDLSEKFLVVPWLTTDGAPFPDGAHLALTHWSLGGTNGNPSGQQGVWQYCRTVSGPAVSSFMSEYPYSDSPEGNVL